MDDLPPRSTYYNYTYEQENHQANDDVLDYVLTMTVCLNYDIEMLRNLEALYKYTDRFLTIFSLVDANSRLNRKRPGNLSNFNRINCAFKVLSTGQHRTKCNSVSCATLHNGQIRSLSVCLLY